MSDNRYPIFSQFAMYSRPLYSWAKYSITGRYVVTTQPQATTGGSAAAMVQGPVFDRHAALRELEEVMAVIIAIVRSRILG